MGHSDEWTFADYFRYEKEIYRAIISAAVLCQWIAEQPQVRVLVAVDIADLLRRAGHLPVSGEIVEEHKAAVKIDALQNIVCHHHAQQRGSVLPLLKLVVAVPNEGVAAQQMLVRFPLVEDVIALHRRADGVEHIAVAL